MLIIFLVAVFSSVVFAGIEELNFQCTLSGERCKIPFIYENKEYFQCAVTESVTWCPTGPLPSGTHDIHFCTLCEAPSICYMRADEIPSLSWKIDCPPGCANISSRLWHAKIRPKVGGRLYSVDSFVCAAAIREQAISAILGGTVVIQKRGDKLYQVIDSNADNFHTKSEDHKMAPLFAVQETEDDYDVTSLLFSDRKKIWAVIDGSEPQVVVQHQANAVAIAFDPVKSTLYWTDVVEKKIFRANLTAPSGRVQVMSSLTVKTPDGIAIDWVHSLLFWTDAEMHTVSVSSDTGKYPTTLISRRASYVPRAIAVDPKRGYLYVTDWGTEAKIEKCHVTGGNTCRTIVGHNIVLPNGLVLDAEEDLIYWADAHTNTISVATTEGEFRREVINSAAIVKHPFALLLHKDRLYWTDWKRGLQSVNKVTGQDLHLHVMSSEKLAGLATYDTDPQFKYRNRCQYSGCKYLCLPEPLEPRCVCPDGYMPSAKDSTDCIPSATDHDHDHMLADFVTSNDYAFSAAGDVRKKVDKRKRNDREEL